MDAAGQPGTVYLLRLFAVRNALLAAQLARPRAAAPPGGQAWVDLADAAAAAAALRAGGLAPRAAIAVPAGLLAAALAVAGARRLPPARPGLSPPAGS